MVTCRTCGFLCARQLDLQLIGVSVRFREAGLAENSHRPEPICWKHAQPITEEFGKAGGETLARRFLAVINKPRDCGAWMQWQEDCSPREHQDMLDQKALLDWQSEQRQKDWERQEAGKRTDRKWQVFYILLGVALTGLVGWLARLL